MPSFNRNLRANCEMLHMAHDNTEFNLLMKMRLGIYKKKASVRLAIFEK